MTATLTPVLAPDFPRAACFGRHAEMFPAPGDTAATEHARAICHACPELRACRAWAASLPIRKDPGGMFAGASEEERLGLTTDRRVCRACWVVKSKEEFFRTPSVKSGRKATCKRCDGLRRTAVAA